MLTLEGIVSRTLLRLDTTVRKFGKLATLTYWRSGGDVLT